MEAPFTEGVPYLSRQEEARARSIAAARRDKTSVADIKVPADDIGSIEFVQRVRREVTEWVENLRDPSIVRAVPLIRVKHFVNTPFRMSYHTRTSPQLVTANQIITGVVSTDTKSD